MATKFNKLFIRIILLICFICFISIKIGIAQVSMFYTSIQGTWDKEKDKSRAQFGGNNKFIYTYFSEFGKELVLAGVFEVNKTGEVVFRVNDQGSIDSISVNKKIGQKYDKVIKNIILSTDGKWKPGEIDGVKKSEIITLWVHIYNGSYLEKNLKEYLIDGEKYYMEQNYKKALKEIDKALIYDELNSTAVALKAKILICLNKEEKACKILEAYKKYEIVELENLYQNSCKN